MTLRNDPKEIAEHQSEEAKKDRVIILAGWLPVRITDSGTIDMRYLPSLIDLLKMEGKVVLELARLKKNNSTMIPLRRQTSNLGKQP